MSTTYVGTISSRERATKVAKYVTRRILFPVCVLGPIAWFFPKLALFYAICGAYDISRNTGMDISTPRRYFIGNGFFTWVLSPLNILLDILSLPYINKGVYKLEDLPPAYADEVRRMIRIAKEQDLVGKLEARAKDNQRTMIFFRWYGVNVDTFLDIPEFHQGWKYIKTIGVSVFNKKASTSKHFGFMRASIRVLYNINDMKDDSAYIVVGNTKQYWRDDKLFIFDDTLLHQSFNETDQIRYCMFVDIVRPSLIPAVMSAVVTGIRLLSQSFKFVYYKHWKVIDR